MQNTGNPDLTFDEVEGYANNFYVPVKEKSTGRDAFELIVDRYSGTVMPEMGPNMMWNTKYGMMTSGMMGPGGMGPGGMMRPGTQTPTTVTPTAGAGAATRPSGQVTPTVDTPIDQNQAVQRAQQFLDGYLPGTKVGDVYTFYGYRTIGVDRNGQQVGMVSVNGYTGAVWYHTWHGDFLETWHRTS